MSKTVFVVSAKPRVSTAQPIHFLIESESHRQAWEDARKTCRTGEGAFVRETEGQTLVPLTIRPATFTVDRVLSTHPHRKGRPPRITVEDLTRRAQAAGVRVPPRVARVIDELVKGALAA